MANKIQIRRDTTANWTASNPILSQGELGLDTTLNKMKIGDGVSHWSELSFFIGNTGATGATGATGLQGPAGVTQLSNLTNSSVSLSLNATGSLTFPTLSVDIHNGGVQSAQVLKFDDATKQVIITGPTPAAGNSAERIIIQGQRATGTGEGGDVYLWGGDSAINGGDIKIYAGDADSDVSGAVGGYVNIDAGNGFTNGGNLTLSAGVARDGYGGNVNITAGYAYNGTPGNIQLNTYAQADSANLAWTFTNDGKLQLPEGGDIVNNAGNSITDIYKFEGGTIGTKNNAPTSNGWGGYNMYLDPGGESWASIFIPSVANQDSGTALQITNKGAATSIVQVIGWGGIQLVTNTGVDENVFEFNDNGSLSFPKGSNVSETSNTVAIAPPTAAAGQSLVIRPTTVAWGLAASGYIVYGSPITVSVTTIGGSSYFGTVNYTFSGCTAEQLGRALTGQITFPGGNTGNPQTITWTIPANSNITTFTLTLGSAVGVFGTDFNFELNGLPDGQFVTVTNNGITNSEFSHVHLVAGDPATVDIYLGDDDQYVKIEKNAGDVVIGTNLDTHQWTFGTDSRLTLPNASTISPVAQVGSSYGPYASDVYDNTTGGALGGGTETSINIGNTVHNDLFDPPVVTASTTTGTIAANGDFDPGTSTGTFDADTRITVGGQPLGSLYYIDENNTAAGFTLSRPGIPYSGPVVTAGTLISGYAIGWSTRTPKTTTYIKWADGSRSQVIGSRVNLYPNTPFSGLITADDVRSKSFPATLYTENYIPSGTAIGVNNNNWKFGTDGKLNLPGSTFIDTSPNYIHASHGIGLHPSHNTGGTGPELYIYYNDGIVVQPFTNDYITPGDVNGTFAAAPLFIRGSNLPNTNDSIGKLPGNVYIAGGWNPKDATYGKVVVNSGTNQWTFGTTGRTTFPNGTVPAHSYGAAGDKEGMVVFSDNYIYYCKQDYVSNSVNVTTLASSGLYVYVSSTDYAGDLVADFTANSTGWTYAAVSIISVAVDDTFGPGYILEAATSFGAINGNDYALVSPITPNIWKRVSWSIDTW